jgi:hypothetical protein
MINFLPEKLKKQVKTEYLLRGLTVLFGYSFFVMVIVSVFIVPSFVLSMVKKDSIIKQLDMVKKSSVNQTEDILSKTRIINEFTNVLSPKLTPNRLASDFIKSAIGGKVYGIKVSSISTQYEGLEPSKITLSGFSYTRDLLIEYVKELKDLDMFSNVDIPVSTLVKVSNIDFSIVLTLKKE